MSSLAHERALKAVQDNLLGNNIVEVTHKVPWGFDEIDRRGIVAEDFAGFTEVGIDTCILHILFGERVKPDLVRRVVDKALEISTRVLILEHNPYDPAFADNENVSLDNLVGIKNCLHDNGFEYERVDIDGRNLLYVVTTLGHFDDSLNQVNNSNLERLLSFQYRNGLPESGKNVFCLTSEIQRDDSRLLSRADAFAIDRMSGDSEIYSVVGGMMFLELITELERTRTIHLFDVSLPQVLLAYLIVEVIKSAETLEDFDDIILGRIEVHKIVRKLGGLIKVELLLRWLCDSRVTVDRPDKEMVWKNIIKIGRWRKHYEKVRDTLVSGKIKFHFGGMPDYEIPNGSILYTSTVEPERWEHYNCHIVEAYSERDKARLRR